MYLTLTTPDPMYPVDKRKERRICHTKSTNNPVHGLKQTMSSQTHPSETPDTPAFPSPDPCHRPPAVCASSVAAASADAAASPVSSSPPHPICSPRSPPPPRSPCHHPPS